MNADHLPSDVEELRELLLATHRRLELAEQQTTELATMIDAGRLEPVIDRVFPYDQIAEAMAYLETGRAKGKVVVQMRAE